MEIILIYFRLQDEENENPCFPTRNDRLAFINDNIVRERCVCGIFVHFGQILIFFSIFSKFFSNI